MNFKDYYKILDVDPKADKKEIKTAYRKLARKYHPDLSDHKNAEEKFKEVSEAYEVLKDTEKRAEFDELRQYGVHGQSFKPPPGWQPGGTQGQSTQHEGDFSDFFSSIFGSGFTDQGFSQQEADRYQRSGGQYSRYSNASADARAMRGQDVEMELPIFLEDTLKKTNKKIAYQLDGEEKTLNVKIPAGISNGERIRLKGQGGAGYGDTGPNGDLYLRIRLVPHPLFDIEGHNLIIVLPLAPWEAALGAKIDIPTLDGKVRMTIPENSRDGQRLRIKNKGLSNKQNGYGDLFANIKIVMPTENRPELKDQWLKLAEMASFDPRKEWGK